MKIRTEAEKEYRRFHGQKAINAFFKAHKELEEPWREVIEWMSETGTEFYCDNVMADGSKNLDWSYALHFEDEENYTYICIIERR